MTRIILRVRRACGHVTDTEYGSMAPISYAWQRRQREILERRICARCDAKVRRMIEGAREGRGWA